MLGDMMDVLGVLEGVGCYGTAGHPALGARGGCSERTRDLRINARGSAEQPDVRPKLRIRFGDLAERSE